MMEESRENMGSDTVEETAVSPSLMLLLLIHSSPQQAVAVVVLAQLP